MEVLYGRRRHARDDRHPRDGNAGGYVSPTAFSSASNGDVPDQARLSTALHGGALRGTPSATWLRATDTATFTLRRKQQYHQCQLGISGTRIGSWSMGRRYQRLSTEYPERQIKTIDLAAVSGGPVVRESTASGDPAQRRHRCCSVFFVGGPAPSTNAFRHWAEGDQLTTASQC